MNYIKEMNSFYDWLLYNPLPTGAIALWHAIMAINNKAGWADEFTVANIVLQGMTGLSRQGLDRARNILIQKGLVSYKKGTSNQAGKYKMISLECNKIGTVVVTPKDTKKLDDDVDCKIIGTEHDTKRAQSDTQSGHNSSTLNKLNKTKLNDINTSTTTEQKEVLVLDKEFSELAKLYQSAGIEYDGFTSDWIIDSKERYGFEWVKNAILEASNQGARNRAYINKILNNWKTWGGMKLSTDKNDINKAKPKVATAVKTRFHNFEGRTDNYSGEQLEDIAARKRREHVAKMKSAKESEAK